MTSRGHVPQRQCAGCGGKFAKGSLVRFTVALTQAGRTAVLDFGGSGEGRGAYTCPNFDCLERALKRKALARRLRAAVAPGPLRDDFKHLLDTLTQNGEKKNLRDSKGA